MSAPYDTTQQCLGISEVSAWLGTSVRHIRRLISERRIPYHKVGGLIRFVPSEIEEWLDGNRFGPGGDDPRGRTA